MMLADRETGQETIQSLRGIRAAGSSGPGPVHRARQVMRRRKAAFPVYCQDRSSRLFDNRGAHLLHGRIVRLVDKNTIGDEDGVAPLEGVPTLDSTAIDPCTVDTDILYDVAITLGMYHRMAAGYRHVG